MLGELPPDPFMLDEGPCLHGANPQQQPTNGSKEGALPGGLEAWEWGSSPCAANGKAGVANAAGGGSGNSSCEAAGAAVEAARQGDLELRGVSFAYPTRPGVRVLEGLSLILPRGCVTALVGR